LKSLFKGLEKKNFVLKRTRIAVFGDSEGRRVDCTQRRLLFVKVDFKEDRLGAKILTCIRVLSAGLQVLLIEDWLQSEWQHVIILLL
jgi:hypothetical protein